MSGDGKFLLTLTTWPFYQRLIPTKTHRGGEVSEYLAGKFPYWR